MGESQRSTALVVGAASGLGAASAQWFGAAGWDVAVADLNEQGARAVAARIQDHGGNAAAFAVDVRATDAVDAAVALVGRTFGRIDAVVACAGVIAPGAAATMADADWDRLINVHLSGTFRCARSSCDALAASKGAFVAVSSVAGRLGMHQRASYCAAKAGVEGLVRSLAVEWAQLGIRVNAVAPGYIETELVTAALDAGAVRRSELERRTPLGRLGRPEEVAAAIGFLASSSSSYITGAVLAVDGGFIIDAGL